MKSINHQAPVLANESITINANPEKVWEIITSINNWPSWQTDISNSKLNGTLQSGTSFVWKTGGSKIQSTLHTVKPFTQFGWTGKTFGVFAIHNWTLTSQDGKTVVLVEESMEGLLAKLFSNAFNKMLEKGMLNWLDLLKKECEK